MSWQDILKNDEKEDLEIKLEDLVNKWGDDKDIGDYDAFEMGNGPNLNGVEIEVTFEDMYEGEEYLTQEQKLENDVGHYQITFSSTKNVEFAISEYTYNDGYQMHESYPEKLDINELKAAIEALR